MEIFKIISDFITQDIPDFATNAVEYLLLGLIMVCMIGVIRR